jgi:hypothetical protein
VEEKDGTTRRLVLGFDAGCMTCSELARRIEERVGNKLEVLSLNDPFMARWREQALGKDAPWVPTLVEVEGDAIRAWTGVRMGARLSRVLGPVATWRMMQVLGEANADHELADSTAVNAISGLTRGQFLKGVGGAAVAVSTLRSCSKKKERRQRLQAEAPRAGRTGIATALATSSTDTAAATGSNP